MNKHLDSAPLTIIGSGIFPVDIISHPEPGQGLMETVPRLRAGGTCGNVLAICGALGAEVHAVGRLDAADPAASRLREDLAHWGVGLTHLFPEDSKEVPLIFELITTPGQSRPHPLKCPRCGGWLPPYKEITIAQGKSAWAALPRCDVLLLDRAPPANKELARLAAEAEALVVFEPISMPTKAQIQNFRAVLQQAHVVKYSGERPRGFAEVVDFPRSPLLEVQTLGADGLRYSWRGADWRALPPFEVMDLVDPTGAGDICTAVFLLLTARGGVARFQELTEEQIRQSLRVAQAAAAWTCRFPGARGAMYQTVFTLADHRQQLLGPGPGLTLPEPPQLEDTETLEQTMVLLCPHCREVQEAEPRAPAADMTTWRTQGRPGYVGKKTASAARKLDAEHGPGDWCIAYTWRGEIITRDEALELYTEAYVRFFEANPKVLQDLVSMARDVYDLAPADVAAGTDYSIQRPGAVHLQDIAVRIAVSRLGQRFQGQELIQIRSRSSKGAHLSPGVVPFHEPDGIELPELEGWWGPGTVESFWQSNKVLQVRQKETILVFGGSFDPIHNGHLALARFARERCGVDHVLLIPNGDNYSSKNIQASAKDRLDMVQAAAAGEPALEVVDTEARSTARLRVVTTTREIRERFPGDDLLLLRSLDSLPKTHKKLFAIAGLRVLVLDREGFGKSFKQVLAGKRHLQAFRSRIQYMEGAFQNPISSTQVRRAVAAGQPLDRLVPPAVATIIRERGLYRAPGSA